MALSILHSHQPPIIKVGNCLIYIKWAWLIISTNLIKAWSKASLEPPKHRSKSHPDYRIILSPNGIWDLQIRVSFLRSDRFQIVHWSNIKSTILNKNWLKCAKNTTTPTSINCRGRLTDENRVKRHSKMNIVRKSNSITLNPY